MRSYTAPRWQALANAVIRQAIMDTDETRLGKNNTKIHREDDIRFLANSRELEFYASLAECEKEMMQAGYLKLDSIAR